MPNRPWSLLLAAHGSLAAENSNQPLHDLANSIAKSAPLVVPSSGQYCSIEDAKVILTEPKATEGSTLHGLNASPNATKRIPHSNFAVVTPAFLNGEPELSSVLETLPPGDVVVVPVMTSQGYYLQKLRGKLMENSNFDQFRFLMTSVVGMHRSIPERIGQRITHLLAEYQMEAAETTVVVIGHGTRRNATSGQSTFELTATLADQFSELTLETAFLDQDPTVDAVAANIKTRHTLLIPFLISRGPHSTEDVPQAFGLPSGPDVEFPLVRQNKNGICICDLPVGMYPEMAEVCLELAHEAMAKFEPIELFASGGISS